MTEEIVQVKREVGRPTVRNEEINRKIEEAAALGSSIEEIAFYINVWRSTLYRWMAEDPELKDRIEELQEKPILKARQTIIKSLDNPDDARWYLEKKKKREFGNSVDITSGGEKITPSSPEAIKIAEKYEEELKKLL